FRQQLGKPGDPERIDVRIKAEKDKPDGSIALRGARIITEKGDEIFERGDIVVTNNRIAAVGKSGSLQIPKRPPGLDVSGKTIIPGYVDTHAHTHPPAGVHREQVPDFMAMVAYGMTTVRDPQTGTTDVLAYQDLVSTGDMIGPRIFSTGPGIFGSDNITSL